MRNKTKVVTLFVFSIFLLSSFALSSQNVFSANVSVKATKNIAVVFSTGGLGDKSFNDAAYEGMIRANDTYDIHLDWVEPSTVTEINNAIENFASSTTNYDLIIAIGFSSADGVNASALAHPEQKFMIIDSVVDLPNVASVVFKEQEGSFLAGAMAAMTSKTGIIAFLGGLDIPLINRFRAGYTHGAFYINSSIKVLAQYAPDANNPWGDLAGGKSVALNFIDQGADVIYAAAGGTGLGVFDAVNETRQNGNDNVWAIGVDSNQDYLYPGMILTSMVKRVDVAVETEIGAVVDDTWANGTVSLGLAENGVGISEMLNTTTQKNAIYEGTTTRYQEIEALSQKIVDGDIVVAETVDDLSTITGTSTTPGFELIAGIFSFAVITVIYKRRKEKFE
jgi:basic membrane protein A